MRIFNKFPTVAPAIAITLGLLGPVFAYAAGPAAVDLLSLSTNSFVILSKAGVTNTGSHTSVVTGNVGSSPITAAAMDNLFCTELSGTMYGVDAAYTGSGSTSCFAGNPPLSNKTLVDNAVLDMETAYNDAAGRTNPTANGLGGGDIGGMTLAPGLYKWTTSVTIPVNLTLSGGPDDVWIFQIAGNLTVGSAGSIPTGIKVILAGGAKASNVFWQVGGVSGATLGTYSTFNGTILSAKQINIQTGAVLNGRALAQTQVTLDGNIVTVPTSFTPPPSPTPSPVSSGRRDGTINVVKTVVNDSGGTKLVSDFPLFVDGRQVLSGETNNFAAPHDQYAVTETIDSNYTRSFSGDCDENGRLNLTPGQNQFCIVTNNDIGVPIAAALPVPPLIDVLKVPSPLALPNGPGPVAYTYTLRNIGTVPVTNVTMIGDTCRPIVLVSGDTNEDKKLDMSETWVYRCTTTISETHTSTVVATGQANGLTATDIASATVVIGAPVVPPLIHVTKVPSPIVLVTGGGMVTYTERITNPGAVALSNVKISDDKCSPLKFISGDSNNDSKLDTTETWTYTCQTNLTQTTVNTVVVSGEAKGLIARDFAVVTVAVATVGLPQTGTFNDEVRTITVNLKTGSRGDDVRILQQFLISQNKGPAARALASVGATAYFGELTRAALAEFQKAVGIEPPLGNFGPITRAYIAANY
jgi:hypothetical protein